MDNSHGRRISVSELIGMRKCVKTLPFFNLGLAINNDGRLIFFRDMKKKLGEALLTNSSKDDVLAVMNEFFNTEYPESSFTFRVQYETAREKDWGKLLRFLNFYFSNGYEVLSTNVSFEVPLETEYRGVMISTVTGKADFILQEPNGTVVAIMLRQGKPEYSYSARKLENRVCYSLELLLMYLGLRVKFPELDVALFCLKNKDDKGSTLKEQFERGKNFVQWHYNSRENAAELLSNSLSFMHEGMCAGCWYADVCRIQPYQSGGIEVKPKSEGKKYSLTASQEQVVHHKDGPMNVIAVPGSGKTFSLVERLSYLLKEEKIDPDRILFVTFTQKAAGEIRERVKESLGNEGTRLPAIYTFNALGYSILRNYPEKLDNKCKIADKVDRYRLIEQCLSEVPKIGKVSYDGITGEYGLLSMLDKSIDFISTHGIEAYRNSYAKYDVDGIYCLYQSYEKAYYEAGYIGYDEQIALANELFAENEAVIKSYQERYRYVMVDEFQDVSEPQMKLIYSIAAHGNIVVVGDDDQTIYKWRGGTNVYMLNFSKDWKGAKTIIMEDNFRSVNTILDASNALIENNGNRFKKKVLSHMEAQNRPVYLNNFTSQDIWDVIVSPAIEKGYDPGDIAVIARTNSELMDIQKALKPYIKAISPKTLVVDDAVFMSIRDVFSLYYDGLQDNRALYRFFTYCGCEFSESFVCKSLYDTLVADGLLLPICVQDIECLPKYEARKDESHFMKAGYVLIKAFKSIQYAIDPMEALINLCKILFEEESHPVLDVFLSKADDRGIATIRELYSYMGYMERYADTTEIEYPVRKDAVNLLTAHKSKGKEFPLVIVFGAERFDDTEDGRCLLYVAMTRAKRTLYLTQGQAVKAPLFGEIEDYVAVYKRA